MKNGLNLKNMRFWADLIEGDEITIKAGQVSREDFRSEEDWDSFLYGEIIPIETEILEGNRHVLITGIRLSDTREDEE